MKKKILRRPYSAAVIFFSLGLFLSFSPASSKALTFDLDTEFSGAQSPSGSSPWLKAIFTDVSDGVNLQLISLLQSPSEFVGKQGWFFNLAPNLDPQKLVFVYVSGTAANTIGRGLNTFKANGDGYFDINFTWGANVFGEGDSAKYLITSMEAISAYSFNFLSAPGGGAGTYYSAAHVQGINIAGAPTGSGWIGSPGTPIPEPSTLLLFSSGLLGLWGFRKKFKK